MYREVWDDTGKVSSTGEPSATSLQHQSSQYQVAGTSIPSHFCHTSQSGALLKHAAVQQPSNTVVTSLPSSVNWQASESTGLLVQLQQLVESCGLSDQASSGLMNWFTQELQSVSHTLGMPPKLESRHIDNVQILSTSGGTSETRMLEMDCTQNSTGELPSASVQSAQIPATLSSQEALRTSAIAASADKAVTQSSNIHYSTGEVQPTTVAASVDQLNSLAQLQQLQQVYLESAANALHGLFTLQQQLASAVSTTAHSAVSTNSTTIGTAGLDVVHTKSSDYAPHFE